MPARASPGERGNALAEMLACRAIATRYGYQSSSTPDLRVLAEAIVLPSPAARDWADGLDVNEIAATLVTTPDLVERRLQSAGGRSSMHLACVPQAPVFAPDFSATRPLAKVSGSAGILHLSDYRGARAGVRLGGIKKR